ncbi:endonuclease/exonuclease/phosphatase family protein [Metabacillus malikii]|uniref:Maltose 6'-phosphate phosphatase n=1 Tax=Metabacillus malikii TaxID=1504265 RepID=A0ABT9ZJT7_9BACI|nr:endonuclease/exonuclease/phosphatase family protein [Metabacillus malikii]MDQ0232558.1 maltose 6'-phosphate phosphatase [Metabacillus malikii]
MKLLTLNCHSWQEEDQLNKIKILANTIKERDYDIIALQEVSQLVKGNNIGLKVNEGNFVSVLLDELQKIGVTNYVYHWDCSHIGYDKYEEGLAVLSKHKIVNKTSFYISHSNDIEYWKTRKIVGISINNGNEEISFYSCHLGWWNDEEEPYSNQVDTLIKEVETKGRYFLMGDFNNDANKREEGYDYILNKGLFDLYHLAPIKDDGYTVDGNIAGWEQNVQAIRIDCIFSNFPVETVSSQVIFNGKNKPIISDHYGVEVEIKL